MPQKRISSYSFEEIWKKNNFKIDSSFDLQCQLRKIATDESIKYIQKNMKNCLCFTHSIDVLFDYTLPKIDSNGLILEFGVRKGNTIKEISKRIKKKLVMVLIVL